MGISLLSFIALFAVLYFGWGLVDPETVTGIEDKLAHGGTRPFSDTAPLRFRNSVGLAICLLLLGTSMYHDLRPRISVPAEHKTKPPLALPSAKLEFDQFEHERSASLTLEKQVEQQREAARAEGEQRSADGLSSASR